MNLSYKELTINESFKILSQNNYCHIAFSKNDKPYLIPMSYEFHKINDIYYIKIVTLKNCKKMNYLNGNKFVNINIQEVINNSVISIMVYGVVYTIEDLNELMYNVYIKLDHITGRLISNNINN